MTLHRYLLSGIFMSLDWNLHKLLLAAYLNLLIIELIQFFAQRRKMTLYTRS